jgi:hypothetical protein
VGHEQLFPVLAQKEIEKGKIPHIQIINFRVGLKRHPWRMSPDFAILGEITLGFVGESCFF